MGKNFAGACCRQAGGVPVQDIAEIAVDHRATALQDTARRIEHASDNVHLVIEQFPNKETTGP